MSAGWSKSTRILAVDDEPINLEVLSEILMGTCELRLLSRGEDVLAEVKDWRPHVIVMDIMMPGQNGYDVCKSIRESLVCPFAKIMLVTGKALSEERLKGYEVGADEYLVKPFLHEEFIRKVNILSDLANREEAARLSATMNFKPIARRGENGPKSVIFAVDDDPINLEVIKECPFENATVECFSSGTEFLEAIKAGRRPDLVLMDIMMPGLNGFETCQEFRKVRPISESPLIFLSALIGVDDIDRGFLVGGNDFIRKPFEPKELVRRAATLLMIYRYSSSIRRFVPWPMLAAMDQPDPTLAVAGDCKVLELTLMFADLRGFTSTSEFMDPASAFSHLQEHIETIAPLVEKDGGWVDKYIGDCLMACFPGESENSLECALNVLASTSSKMAIALHSGTAALGWIGAEGAKIEGTVVSDLVNSASRLEGIAKQFGVSVVASETVYRAANQSKRFQFRLLGKFRLSGKITPVSAYELISADPYEIRNQKLIDTQTFETAVLHFHAGNLKEANSLFQQVLERNPNDKAAAAYLVALLEPSKMAG